MPYIFFVEGNIGTGKSTFLNMIEKHYGDKYQVIYEPLDLWIDFKDKKGKNILEYFYEDPKRYSYTFQNIAFISRVENLKKIDLTKEYIFIERSIWSDKNVFAKNCYDNDMLSDIEFKLYNKWFECLSKTIEIPDHKFLYLKCPVDVSFERLTKRSRKEENTISLEYLTQIENKHEEWFKDHPNVSVIDATSNYKDEHVFKEVFGKVVKQ